MDMQTVNDRNVGWLDSQLEAPILDPNTGGPNTGGPNTGDSVAGSASVRLLTCSACPEVSYYLAEPDGHVDKSRVLVCMHGISRNAREHAFIFSKFCNELGWVVVAPLFLPSSFPKYQRLGFAKNRRHPRPDLALNMILSEVEAKTRTSTDSLYMFGFSGGGQFVHRYCFAHPDRVAAAALGSPGWYTFPDGRTSFPRGMKVNPRTTDIALNEERALQIPIGVFVGTQDLDRDETLRSGTIIDKHQGLTRPARGRNWVSAMQAAAVRRGLGTNYEYHGLEGCGHSFTDCITNGQLDLKVIEFLQRAGG